MYKNFKCNCFIENTAIFNPRMGSGGDGGGGESFRFPKGFDLRYEDITKSKAYNY